MAEKVSLKLHTSHLWALFVVLLLAIPAIQPFLRNELTVGYDNVLHLWRSLEEIGEAELAQTAHETMLNFGEGFTFLKNQIATSAMEHTALLKQELTQIERELKNAEK